jgi:hypothetical protein
MAWDDNRRHTEIIATRIYFLLVTLAIIILIIYTSAEIQTQHIVVYNPSEKTFEQLQSNPQYLPTLECPCTNIDIPYGTFISISPQLHQLCSSDFIVQSSLWMSLIYSRTADFDYSYHDFRVFVVPEFQSVISLCILANETLTNGLNMFISNTLVSDQVQSRKTIETQANTSLVQFQLSTSRTFLRTLDYIRHMVQGNGIVSSILSNWHFLSLDTSRSWVSLWSEPRSYGNDNCSCGTSAMCTAPANIDQWLVPGFLVGCYPHEALLQSTLECLYDIICVDRLKTMYYTSNITFHPLDPTLSTPNATVQSLVDTLMVVEWQTSVIYEQYYTACAPLSCTYSINQKTNALYIISTIIALYGGLSVVLKLIVPVSIRTGRHSTLRRRRQVQLAITVPPIQE